MSRTWAQFDPQNAQAWFSLGNALVATRQYAEARAAYDTAIARGESGDRLQVVRAGARMGRAHPGGRPLAGAIAAVEARGGAQPPRFVVPEQRQDARIAGVAGCLTRRSDSRTTVRAVGFSETSHGTDTAPPQAR